MSNSKILLNDEDGEGATVCAADRAAVDGLRRASPSLSNAQLAAYLVSLKYDQPDNIHKGASGVRLSSSGRSRVGDLYVWVKRDGEIRVIRGSRRTIPGGTSLGLLDTRAYVTLLGIRLGLASGPEDIAE